MKRFMITLFCAGALTAGATVIRSIDAESASIDSDDWELHDNGYDYVAITKGEPEAPWISPSQYVSGGHGIGYDIRPTSGLYDGQTMDKINHRILYGGDPNALTFGNTRYYSFYVKLADNHFEIPEGTFILVQWWQGSPHNPPVSLQVLPDTPTNESPQFAFFCKDDETGGLPSETAKMIFQGEMPIGEWQHFIVKLTPSYVVSGQPGEINVWHNDKLLNSLVNKGAAYTGCFGYKPATLGGIVGANTGIEAFIGIYRSRQMKRTQVFFDDVEFADSYTEPTGSAEAERYSLGRCGISLELENCSDVTSPMVCASDSDASAGQYLWVPEGTGNGAGEATYYLEIPESGDYYIWMRGSAPDAAGNSFFAAFNDDAFTECGLRTDVTWRWNVSGPFSLNVGTNTLTIKCREDGAKFDCVHVGTIYQAPPVEKSEFLMEAENAGVTSPMAVASDSAAWAGHYVVTPNGTGNGTGGEIEWIFDLDVAANLYVWGRVYASTGADNSFFIKQNGGTLATWSVPDDDTDFFWRKYGTAFSFSDGTNSIILETREDGAQIDKLYIGSGDPTAFE